MRARLVTSSRSRTVAAAAAVAGTSLLAPVAALADPPDDLELVQIASGLDRPTTIVHAGDGSGRLFITEQPGTIRVWAGGNVLGTPFLDLTALVDDVENEQGLLGLAFDPAYETTGLFYVNYTTGPPGNDSDKTRVARYQVSADPNVANPDSAFTILEIDQPTWNHNGGNVVFGPDGYLYVGMGDGGGGYNTYLTAQDLGSLLGKMLRLDVSKTTPTPDLNLCGLVQAYDVPDDNPGLPYAQVCAEIWALGLRNPWRWSFDRFTGDVLIGDVGQNQIEEIDFQPASSPGGENYGWACFEGTDSIFPGPGNACVPGMELVPPVHEYTHSSGCAVTGGYRYRGQRLGGLGGVYVYGDACSGRIWLLTLDENGQEVSNVEWADTSFAVGTFGEDEQGELYLSNLYVGEIYRFESPSSIFTDGVESSDTAYWSGSASSR